MDAPEWTPEVQAAFRRHQQRTATLDDLVLLAIAECEGADRALPPRAVAPNANNMGEVLQADPWHASACAIRAIGCGRA